mmetsp:Transcript_34290/g.52662  ORF Transcript_34290/g.52662 Transcript_34290/m.52662 type:complete len:100 (+) Transcript_34290:69-368(+)
MDDHNNPIHRIAHTFTMYQVQYNTKKISWNSNVRLVPHAVETRTPLSHSSYREPAFPHPMYLKFPSPMNPVSTVEQIQRGSLVFSKIHSIIVKWDLPHS